VAFAMAHYEMSERQACKLVDLNRSSYRYEPRPDHNAELRQTLVELARQKPRYGYRRLHAVLSRRGSPVSPQRVYRLYKAEGLMVRRLRRKRLSRTVKALHMAVLHGPPWLDMDQSNLPLFAPAQKVPAGQLRPIVATNRFRLSPTFDHSLQRTRHSKAR